MSFRSSRRVRGTVLAIASTALVAAGAAPAQAESVSADGTSDESCIDGARSDDAVVTRTLEADAPAIVTSRLAGEGEWDLAMYEEDGRRIDGSIYPGGEEIAQGFTTGGDVIVQACRAAGSSESADLTTDLKVLEARPEELPLQLVSVSVPDEAAEERLQSLGLDMTEHGGDGTLDVVLHGFTDAALLSDQGFDYQVQIPDLIQDSLNRARADRMAARAGGPSGLPSGRTDTYREQVDYSEELQALAEDNPKLVKYFTLKKKTYEGRKVEAIEIAPNVKRKNDGKPVFLMMGAHHAREWPSAEHTIEFAYDLVKGFKNGNKKTKRLMRRSRVILIPIVNPDGFSVSRGAAAALDGGRGGVDETANLIIPMEYHRKNCRIEPTTMPAEGDCSQVSAGDTGLAHFGVDPNRNYGGFWGGPGATPQDGMPFGSLAQDYRGPGPFSEPETQNIRKLVSKRQVTTLITNHTFSNLLLRPPGLQSAGDPPDEKVYKKLGDSMAKENGYASQKSFQLYDTTGGTEDWTYYATGGLGFTFEIGPNNFHPPFDEMVAEYDGTAEAADGGGGNRAAYFKALKSTGKTKMHSLIKGKAPAGAVLKITKKFKTSTSPVIDGAGEEGKVIRFKDKLSSKYNVPKSGSVKWHINPSTRPVVDPRRKLPQPKKGKPSKPKMFTGDISGAAPCLDAETNNPLCFNDHPFKVKGGKGVDNGTATVRISWPSPASDWDMKIYRDGNGDGKSESKKDKVVGSSAQGTTNVEEATVSAPGLKPGKYVARVSNFGAVEPYDGRITFGKTQAGPRLHKESWVLTCRPSPGAQRKVRTKVKVDRGERATINLASACD